MDIGVASFIIFIVTLALIVYLKRENLQFQGVLIMLKTKKLRNSIKKAVKKYPLFWKSYFTIGIFISFLGMGFGIYFLLFNALNLLSGFGAPTLSLVFPGPTSTFSVYPGVLLVPIWFWLIAIVVLIFPHELSHGLALALNKLRIKSLGVFLLLFIPGAFVEPDEKQLKKAEKFKKLQVYAAGSFSNIVIGFILVLLFHFLLFSAFSYQGLKYGYPTQVINSTKIIEINNLSEEMIELKTSEQTYLLSRSLFELQKNRTWIRVFEDWPAARNNLSGSIKKVNDVEINSRKDLASILSEHKPGDTIKIETSEGIYNITLADKNGRAFLGVSPPQEYIHALSIIPSETLVNFIFPQTYKSYKLEALPENVGNFIYQLIFFVYNVCFGVAIINILPIKPLDGGFIIETLTNRRFANLTSLIFFVLLVFNIVGPWI